MPSNATHYDVFRLSLDVGNYSTLSYYNESHGVIHKTRSLIIERGLSSEVLPGTPTSPVIGTLDKRGNTVGSVYHVGEAARNYFSGNHMAIADVGKYDYIRTLFYAVVPEEVNGRSVEVVVSVPNLIRNAKGYADVLKPSAHHDFMKNTTRITFPVVSVICIPEGYGSYLLAKRAGLIPDKGHTVVLDIGGGTFCTVLVTQDGRVPLEYVFAKEQAGVRSLARLIARDIAPSVGDEPDVSLIMDGLASDMRYGYTDISLEESTQKHLPNWASTLASFIKTEYHKVLPSITRYIVTGGGALLFKKYNLLPEKFVYSPNPETDNVVGGYLYEQ